MLPKFYFINLDKCNERKSHMESFFKKIKNIYDLNITYERIPGLDACSDGILNRTNNLLDLCSLDFNKLYHSREQNRKLKLQEFGCIYSHLLALKRYINDKSNNQDFAIICEDDIDLFKIKKENFYEIIKIVNNFIPSNEIISLSCVGSPILIENISKQINSPILLEYNSHKGALYGTGCYMITRKCATNIINKYFKNDKLIIDETHNSIVADHFLYPQSNKSTFLIPSLIATRESNESLIHPDHIVMQENNQKMMFNLWIKFNVADIKKKSIITNNEWGVSYINENNNSPTNGTCFKPEDFINFLENFDDFIKEKIHHKEKSNTNYVIGTLETNGLNIEVHFINQKEWIMCEEIWNNGINNLPKNKDDIVIKMCDREFKGRFTNDIINRFLKLEFKNKNLFLSEYKIDNIDEWTSLKNFLKSDLNECKIDISKIIGSCLRIIPKNESDNDKKTSPNAKKLFKLCGVS